MIISSPLYPRIGVGVLLFNNKKELLLVLRTGSHGAQTWAPVGGHLEFGETLEQCACREVEEEIGIIITKPTFYALTNDIFWQEQKHYISIFMQAEFPANQQVKIKEPHKIQQWKWVPFDQLPPSLFLPLEQLSQNKGYLGREYT